MRKKLRFDILKSGVRRALFFLYPNVCISMAKTNMKVSSNPILETAAIQGAIQTMKPPQLCLCA